MEKGNKNTILLGYIISVFGNVSIFCKNVVELKMQLNLERLIKEKDDILKDYFKEMECIDGMIAELRDKYKTKKNDIIMNFNNKLNNLDEKMDDIKSTNNNSDTNITNKMNKRDSLSINNSNNNRYYCDHVGCNKHYKYKGSLTAHKRVHSGNAFECQFCNQKCVNKKDLKKHIRIHTNEKPYKCTYCNKYFSRKDNLVTHTRIHNRNKPYKCKYCNKSFNANNTLTVHIQRKHEPYKNRKYKCSYKNCNKAFVLKRLLDKHSSMHINNNH